MRELYIRTLTALALLFFAFVAILYLPDLLFSLVLFVAISLAVREFFLLHAPISLSPVVVFLMGFVIALSFTFSQLEFQQAVIFVVVSAGIYFLITTKSEDKLADFSRNFSFLLLSVFYLYVPLYFILQLRRLGPRYLFFLLVVIAVGDSGAYFIGSAFGKHKIYPVASPNKSLEGIIAAVVTAGAAGWLFLHLFPVGPPAYFGLISGALIGLVSQVSDPIESLFKRGAGVKDSGTILPGHGGILDRMDSYIFCAPVLFYTIRLFWL